MFFDLFEASVERRLALAGLFMPDSKSFFSVIDLEKLSGQLKLVSLLVIPKANWLGLPDLRRTFLDACRYQVVPMATRLAFPELKEI